MYLDKKQIERIHEITLTDYGFNEKGETDKWDYVVNDLLIEYEDLLEEYNNYKEKILDRFGGN